MNVDKWVHDSLYNCGNFFWRFLGSLSSVPLHVELLLETEITRPLFFQFRLLGSEETSDVKCRMPLLGGSSCSTTSLSDFIPLKSIYQLALYPSMPPMASKRPMVDVRGLVRFDDRISLLSGSRCHFTASMMRGWHSATLPHASSTLSIRYWKGFYCWFYIAWWLTFSFRKL